MSTKKYTPLSSFLSTLNKYLTTRGKDPFTPFVPGLSEFMLKKLTKNFFQYTSEYLKWCFEGFYATFITF